MPTTPLPELCARMESQGFVWGSLITAPSLDAFAFAPSGHRTFMKPCAPTLAFSRIVEPPHTLEWAQWVIDEDFHTDDYARRNVLFARIDERRLAQDLDPRFRGEWRKKMDLMPWIHWSKVAEHHAGILVNPALGVNSDIFPMWDMETAAVWDRACIAEAVCFRNAGQDWVYNDLM